MWVLWSWFAGEPSAHVQWEPMEKAQRWDEIGLIVDGSVGDKTCRI